MSTVLLMSGSEFTDIRDLFYDLTGIFYDESSKYLFEMKIGRRLEELNLTSYQDYYFFLKFDPRKETELTELIDTLTTNETYFFREEYQLKAFAQEIVPEIALHKKNDFSKTIRIWSAGCSTGEEVYTIAMLLNEDPRFKGFDISVYGSDISNRVINIARKGIYSMSSFRCTDKYYIDKYFEPIEKKWRINDSLKHYAEFGLINLVDSRKFLLLPKFDIIFCRNVIIYFDVAAKKKVIENFYQRLNEGGFLLLGHSESLMNISSAFELKQLKNDLVYTKPSSGLGR